MTEGTADAAGASPPCQSYDDALIAFERANEEYCQAKDALAKAQAHYVAECNDLPLPEMMTGPHPTVTEADTMGKIRAVLEMTITDQKSRDNAARRMNELIAYATAKGVLMLRFDVLALEDAAFAAMTKADEALEALVAAPASTMAQFATKMEAVDGAAWDVGDHLPPLTKEARRLADQEESVAEAWVDRWLALGGGFCRSRNRDGTDRGALRSIPMSYTWTPPAQQNPLLQPHEWIVEESDHTGAVKVLEGFLSLAPDLSDAVFAVATEQGLLAKHGEFSHAA